MVSGLIPCSAGRSQAEHDPPEASKAAAQHALPATFSRATQLLDLGDGLIGMSGIGDEPAPLTVHEEVELFQHCLADQDLVTKNECFVQRVASLELAYRSGVHEGICLDGGACPRSTDGCSRSGSHAASCHHGLMRSHAGDLGMLAGDQRGSFLIEIILVLLVVAIAGIGLRTYLSSTQKSLEQFNTGHPLNHARLLADISSLTVIQTQLDLYRSQHGEWPPSRDAVAGLLRDAPRFQCPGNDYTYDPATGAASLLITDPSRC